MEPQLLVAVPQDTLSTFAVTSKVTPQVSWSGEMMLPVKSSARNNWVSPVASVAVAGTMTIRMPEAKLMGNLPVFFLSALAVAVMVTVTLGSFVWSGKVCGAVKVAVDAAVVLVFCMLERTPTAPLADEQSAEAEGFGLGFAVVGLGVVV